MSQQAKANLNHYAAASHSELIAALLRGAWRHPSRPQTPDSLADISLSESQLAALTPLLLGSGAGALAWAQVRKTSLRASAPALELQQAYRVHALRKALQEREIKRVFSLLQEANLQPVLIKGWANAQYYAEVHLRPYGDLDLCLPPQQYRAAATLLGQANPPLDVVTIPSGDCLLELHCGFTDLDDEQDVGMDELLCRTQQRVLEGTPIRVLSAEDHLRLICIHFLRHGAWRPLWLCDIAATVESLPANFDWERCLGLNPRRADWVACALGLAHQLLGANLEDTPLAVRARQLPRWLLPAVLQAWERPCGRDHQTPVSILKSFNPTRLSQTLKERWFNPIEATIHLKGNLNEWPRLPWQVAMYGVRFNKFLMGLTRR